ncbi:MAG: addiction module antidote protein, HigA family [Candidatus Parabeggiatoa sp. nov. 3]|nr:MAG: addiction module antidote protein, HigA family [Gammaproteobacteria bacterium]RKZ62295.1 MAG: addiction module antidote protein, HigA family [Gammaproteobacteria bacterium]RKZ86383.1 MAG: addiction module antidote protein, HigA family [Gammaproteobacteria bacterium]
MRIPTHREPTHPGEMLLEEFLNPMEISQNDLALAIRVPYSIINEIINKKREITPSIALRLAKFLGVSEDFWMNLQLRWDLYHVKKSEEIELQLIKAFPFQKSHGFHPETCLVGFGMT